MSLRPRATPPGIRVPNWGARSPRFASDCHHISFTSSPGAFGIISFLNIVQQRVCCEGCGPLSQGSPTIMLYSCHTPCTKAIPPAAWRAGGESTKKGVEWLRGSAEMAQASYRLARARSSGGAEGRGSSLNTRLRKGGRRACG